MQIDVNVNVFLYDGQKDDGEVSKEWVEEQIEGLVRCVTNIVESNAIAEKSKPEVEKEAAPEPIEPPEPEIEAEPEPEAEPEAEPEQKTEPTEAENTVTLEEIRAKLTALTNSGKQAQVKEIVNRFGEKLSTVPEESYPELLQAAEELK